MKITTQAELADPAGGDSATCSRKGQPRSEKSIELVTAMYEIAETSQPITGRGIGYQLFTRKLILSMSRNEMYRVYRLLKQERERGVIPWEWIVDETRGLEIMSMWDNLEDYAESVSYGYRRKPGTGSPCAWRCGPRKVRSAAFSSRSWIAGGSASVCAMGSSPPPRSSRSPTIMMGAFWSCSTSATGTVLDCSCPRRICRGGSRSMEATISSSGASLWWPASRLPGSPLSPLMRRRMTPATSCWELDAMDPNELRTLVEQAIMAELDLEAWEASLELERKERRSLRALLDGWEKAHD
jgi:hypothetical protein